MKNKKFTDASPEPLLPPKSADEPFILNMNALKNPMYFVIAVACLFELLVYTGFVSNNFDIFQMTRKYA